MKIFYILVTTLILTISLVACKTNKKTNNSFKTIPVIYLEAKSCFGKCKTYKFTLYENMNMHYEGLKNVENLGNFESSCTQEAYEQLTEQFRSMEFSVLEDEYLAGVRDVQEFILEYDGKRVRFHKLKSPPNLRQLLSLTEEFLENVNWVKPQAE